MLTGATPAAKWANCGTKSPALSDHSCLNLATASGFGRRTQLQKAILLCCDGSFAQQQRNRSKLMSIMRPCPRPSLCGELARTEPNEKRRRLALTKRRYRSEINLRPNFALPKLLCKPAGLK